MLTFEASQTWCLTRVLSLAVVSLVMETDNVWQLYLLLHDIIDIILAPSVSEDAHCTDLKSILKFENTCFQVRH